MTTEQQQRLKRTLDLAIQQARVGLVKLDADTQAQLLTLFENAARDLGRSMRIVAGADGVIGIAEMNAVQGLVNVAVNGLYADQIRLIQDALQAAAANGAGVIGDLEAAAAKPGFPVAAVQRLPDAAAVHSEVLQTVVNAIAEDGLDLSDRLWRNQVALREQLMPVLQQTIIEGESARTATRSALARGLNVSPEQLNQIEMARAGALGERAAQILASPEAKAYGDAARVFRTEMDRANILAQRAGVFAVEGVAGTRFLLSPRHPRYDVCDMHAAVNLYGLGPGVYPQGKSPLPAHPNTLSYEEAVFEWEIDETHRTPEELMAWLAKRSDQQLYGILQSEQKVAALRAGLLQPDEITKPWRDLAPKYGPQLQAA